MRSPRSLSDTRVAGPRVPVGARSTAAPWFVHALGPRLVHKTAIGAVDLSTRVLGIEVQDCGDSSPLLYETRICAGERDGTVERDPTAALASLGQAQWGERTRQTLLQGKEPCHG